MNEQIKLLIERASYLVLISEPGSVDDSVYFNELVTLAIAELIIRDITYICYNHPAKIKSNNWTANMVPDNIADIIKQHFGVEE
jgi:hypothetical protein